MKSEEGLLLETTFMKLFNHIEKALNYVQIM